MQQHGGLLGGGHRLAVSHSVVPQQPPSVRAVVYCSLCVTLTAVFVFYVITLLRSRRPSVFCCFPICTLYPFSYYSCIRFIILIHVPSLYFVVLVHTCTILCYVISLSPEYHRYHHILHSCVLYSICYYHITSLSIINCR